LFIGVSVYTWQKIIQPRNYAMNRLFISAAHKSSGKTTLSIGLCAALTAKGYHVQPFKKGPDYIDPLWLSAASGHACHNLDFNTMTHEEILYTLDHYGQSADISIIEANKGLFDGLALNGEDSNAALAELTCSPIILVINTVGTTRGVAPLLLGYQAFDPNLNIAGVIFNRVAGGRHERKLRQVTEAYTDIPVLGAVHKSADMQIEERHLGLMPSNERQDAYQQTQTIAELVAQQVELETLINIAHQAPALPEYTYTRPEKMVSAETVKIGICQDPSFGFYYPGDLEALESAGAELIYINTINDQRLPDALDGLFIGGGFPETQMEALSANVSMKASIHQAIEDGLPVYAECGGLMYLTENLIWQGKRASMVGVIPADAVMHEKPQGRGYIKVTERAEMPWAKDALQTDIINAHEFHYSRLENLREKGQFAYDVVRGQGIDGKHDGWVYKNLLASYAHMRDTSQHHWARRFVGFVQDCKKSAEQV
jgi:cobyrinic acid a,c-diamide synthase